MAVEHFVGRADSLKQVADVLTGRERADGKLTVQSIEGPGGIGKTCLFNHALGATDISDRNYLTLKLDGNDPSAISLVSAVSRIVKTAKAEAIRDRDKPSGYYFPHVDHVTKEIETIRGDAIAEFQKRRPDDQEGRSTLSRFFGLAIAAGKRLNAVLPFTKDLVNVRELEKMVQQIKDIQQIADVVSIMDSLREEVPAFWERGVSLFGWHVSLGGSAALRNAIKENACAPLSDALVSDLSAILQCYRPEDQMKFATHAKIKGIDRLLLILDDYEKLEKSLGEFLVRCLLPSLREANFHSVVVILGRDQLEATHPAWDQHLKANLLKRMVLDPLPRLEMDQLVESYGMGSQDEKDRAWRDTQGFPFYVQLWIEEVKSGGRGAVMLKRFYDKTTRWMSDREKAWLHHTLFLDKIDKRTLRNALGNQQEAEEAFKWFEGEGSVRDTIGEVYRVREYLRSRLIDYLRVSDPDLCEELKREGEAAMRQGQA